MKRSYIRSLASFLLIFVILIQLIPSAFAAERFTTSGDPLNYVDFDLDGSTLTVHGRIRYDGLTYVWVRCGGNQDVTKAADGKDFAIAIPLTSPLESEAVEILVTNGAQYGSYRGYLWGSAFLSGSDGNYKFDQSPVLPNNRSQRGHWINPAECLPLTDITQADRDAIRAASNAIVGSETDNYAKVRLLHRWVAENIYYDFDYLMGYTDGFTWMPAEVLRSHRSVCEGYARLLVDLIRAQGIPAICVINYAVDPVVEGVFNEATAKEDNPNHMYAEAFVDGRWISLDPTWDSGNEYRGGTYYTGAATYEYFDISDEALAWTHKIFDHYASLEKDIPSVWAQDEVTGALAASLVPNIYQSDYRINCDRTDFCRLAMQLVCRVARLNTVQELAAVLGLTLTGSVFPDTSDPAVEVAYYLGIVNGTGNGMFTPHREITRQEAATMLSRVADLLELVPTGEPTEFVDRAQVDSWAKDGVATVSSLFTGTGKQVMGGIGEGKFSPKGKYTREQSILTMYRLYQIAMTVYGE